MTHTPPDFVADLRALRSWPELDGSLWREPYLVEHTYAALYREVRRHIDAPSDVLDLGCGTGYMALELAREGCRVTGVDVDEDGVELARRARQADPLLRDRDDVLTYEAADLADWRASPDSFDVVVASRVLHHVTDLDARLGEIVRWLRPAGRLVCVEFAYDRFDRRGAAWVYEMQGLLQAAGACPQGDRLGVDPAAGELQVWEAWWQEYEGDHELAGYDALLGALRRALGAGQQRWLPYLYWDVLEELALPPEAGAAVAGFLRHLEAHHVAEGRLTPVLFSWVGSRTAAR